MRTSQRLLRISTVLIFSVLLVGSASADQFYFTGTNSINSNYQGSAGIYVNTISNGFTLTVINYVSNPTVQTQILTGIQLNLKTQLSGAALQAGNFTKLNFSTPSTFVSSVTNSGWGLSTKQFGAQTPGSVGVLTLCPAGSGSSCSLKPGIIGGLSASPSATDYSNANNSVKGPGHPTYLLGDQANGGAVFTITGVGDYNKVEDFLAGITFQWGTSAGDTTPGTPGTPGTPVPEPSSLLLLGSGLAGLASIVRRKLPR